MFRRRKHGDGDGLRMRREEVRSDVAGRVFEHLQARCQSSGLRDDEWVKGLTAGQRAVYALGTVEREVQSGGWAAYFWNASGDTFPEASEGARLLQGDAWSTLLGQAEQALPGGYSRGIDARQAALDAVGHEEEERRLRPLDERLYALDLNPATALDRLLGDLIERRAEEFFIET